MDPEVKRGEQLRRTCEVMKRVAELRLAKLERQKHECRDRELALLKHSSEWPGLIDFVSAALGRKIAELRAEEAALTRAAATQRLQSVRATGMCKLAHKIEDHRRAEYDARQQSRASQELPTVTGMISFPQEESDYISHPSGG